MLQIPFGAICIAWCTAMAVAPLRRPRRLAILSWISSLAVNEVPFLFIYVVVLSTLPTAIGGELDTARAWISLGLTGATTAGLVVVACRARHAAPTLSRALAEGLGADWRRSIDPTHQRTLRRHLPWARILLLPWMFGRRDVTRTRDVPYGDGGTTNLLDVYRHRSRPGPSPTLVYLHGGGFRSGRKSREARPLLAHLASKGWTCVSANYHLGPSATAFPRNLVDVKRLIAWLRRHGHEHGVDPDTIVLVGASAGAHLTALAALTANDPTFQPGFEGADTSIAAAVGLYGYYGTTGGVAQRPTTPLGYADDAPPTLIVHGDHDTYAPCDGARALARHLRAVSTNPVVYAELPGAQHSFDLFHSVRFEAVIDAIEAFAAWVRSSDTERRLAEPSVPTHEEARPS